MCKLKWKKVHDTLAKETTEEAGLLVVLSILWPNRLKTQFLRHLPGKTR